jgi:hypothetical protein
MKLSMVSLRTSPFAAPVLVRANYLSWAWLSLVHTAMSLGSRRKLSLWRRVDLNRIENLQGSLVVLQLQ